MMNHVHDFLGWVFVTLAFVVTGLTTIMPRPKPEPPPQKKEEVQKKEEFIILQMKSMENGGTEMVEIDDRLKSLKSLLEKQKRRSDAIEKKLDQALKDRGVKVNDK